MEQVTIKIIYDNCKAKQEFQEDWGFSALIETPTRKVLFDTGNNESIFSSNAKKMGVDLREITDVMFSHKHKDHIAGWHSVLGQVSQASRVYLPLGFPSHEVLQRLQVQTVQDVYNLGEGLYSMVLQGGRLLYEQCLVIQTAEGLVIVTGCAHPGVVNIVQRAMELLHQPIHLVLGGFHLFDKSQHEVDAIVCQTQSLQVRKVAPCHCSGEYAIEQFQKTYGDQFYRMGAGVTITI